MESSRASKAFEDRTTMPSRLTRLFRISFTSLAVNSCSRSSHRSDRVRGIGLLKIPFTIERTDSQRLKFMRLLIPVATHGIRANPKTPYLTGWAQFNPAASPVWSDRLDLPTKVIFALALGRIETVKGFGRPFMETDIIRFVQRPHAYRVGPITAQIPSPRPF